MPRALVDVVIKPVTGFNDKPAGVDENTPPGRPVIVGVGFGADWQYVPEVYENAPLSVRKTVIGMLTGVPAQEPAEGVTV